MSEWTFNFDEYEGFKLFKHGEEVLSSGASLGMHYQESGMEPTEKEAQFIVEACNNYESLKQENEKLKEALHEAICIIHDYSDRKDA